MSGFEVAGAVLGGFPILLKCLDYYRQGFEPLEEWWNFRTSFVKFVDDIRHQMMRYNENMIRLLDPIIADTESLSSLIQDPKDSRWHDGSLEALLIQRLASEHDRFLRILDRMHGTLADLERLLQIENGEVSWLSFAESQRKPWHWHYTRLRISFSKSKHKKISKLSACNQELQEILGYSERVIPIAEKRKSSDPVRLFEKMRQQTCCIYNALQRQWRCERSCQSHAAHLNLSADSDAVSLSLKVLFALGSDRQATLSKPTLHRVEIEQTEIPAATSSINISYVQRSALLTKAQQAVDNQTAEAKEEGSISASVLLESKLKRSLMKTSLGRMSSQLLNRPKKRVEFQKASTSASSLSTCNNKSESGGPGSQPAKQAMTLPNPQSSLQPIQDLCIFLAEEQTQSGLIDDGSDRHFKVCKPLEEPNALASGRLQLVPLPELLRAYANTSIDLPRQSRFRMATHIASALLQAHASPWLSGRWSKHDFFFLFDTTSQSLCSTYPFVSRSFHPSSGSTILNQNTTSAAGNETDTELITLPTAIPYELPSEEDARACLFAVGIILLELIFGQNIEDCRFRREYYGNDNKPNEGTDACTAKRWAKKVLGDSGPSIADVVRRCLDCSFGPRPNFGDVRFRESVYEGVVRPLREFGGLWPEVVA